MFQTRLGDYGGIDLRISLVGAEFGKANPMRTEAYSFNEYLNMEPVLIRVFRA